MSASVLVPVPLQVSPVRASCAASVASLAEASPAGSVAGMTVEVAVEQLHPFGSRIAPFSGVALKKGNKQALGQSLLRSQKVGEKKGGEKKKNLVQVLAGSPVIKYSGTAQRDEIHASTENDSVSLTYCANNAEKGSKLPNGIVRKVMSDSSSDLYSTGDRSHLENLNVEPCSSNSVRNFGKEPIKFMAGRVGKVGNSKDQSNARLGTRLDVGARISPQVDGDGGQLGKEEINFGKRKKRPRATSKPKQSLASTVASASGITRK